MALPAGESPSLRYLVKAEPPVKSAPTLSGSITGVVAPTYNLITGEKLQAGDHILGVPSAGLHANGISLVIKRAMALPEQFLTKLPTGRTLGEECLIPIPSYVQLVEALIRSGVDLHAFLPATGDGVGKLAFDKRPFTYRVHSWVPVPPLFQFMRELGVSIEDCLKTFNWGIGFYIFVPSSYVKHVIMKGEHAGYQVYDLGVVEEGSRQTIFEPEGVILPPPGK
jgi:phosphoribosylformylglycinamidine cyclo-ligase